MGLELQTNYSQYVYNIAGSGMAQWQTADAKNRFTDLVAASEKDGPQVVMRHKDVVAIVLSPDAYRGLVRQANANFAHLLSHSPFGPEDVEPIGMSLSRHR